MDILIGDTNRGRRVDREETGSCTGPSGLPGKLGSTKRNLLNYSQKQSVIARKQGMLVAQQNWKLNPGE